jgi:hypothetical protein
MGQALTWQDRFRYWFDRLLSRGSAAAIGWVVWIAVLLAVAGGLVFWALGIEFDGRTGPVESFWQAFLIAIGAGGIVDTGWVARVSTFFFVFAGVFLTGSLIGVLVAAVTKRLDELRRGRSRVLERDHTVVVGWSPRLMAVIDELLAEEPAGRRVSVVVLADRDKQEMEDEFRARHPGRDRQRVLFRSGNPSLRSDLELVGVDTARSVIVLTEGSYVDAMAVRRALAAKDVEPDDSHVVAELVNARVARSLVASTAGGVSTVIVGEVVSDMFAQAVRAPGMARVFDDLLSFGGHELYVVPPGDLVGFPFFEAMLAVDGLAVLGVVVPGKAPELLPLPDRVITARDRLVVIAERAGTTPARSSVGYEPVDARPVVPSPSRIVMIGWNDMAPGVLDRLSAYLPEGSRIQVMADSTLLPDGLPTWSWAIKGGFTHTKHDPSQILGMISELDADVVAVIGYSHGLTNGEADAMTLLTLLTLDRARDAGRMGAGRIVAQLFDGELAPLARAHAEGDFVITDTLASRMLVHASRDRDLSGVYGELFDPEGPIVDTVEVEPGTAAYGSVVAGLVGDQMVPIGVICDGQVTLNPPQSKVFTFGSADRVAVLRRVRLRDVWVTIERRGHPTGP